LPAFGLVIVRPLPEGGPARARQEELPSALDAARAGTWDFEAATGDLTWSERGKALFGLPDAAVTLGTFLSALHPEDQDRIERAVKQSLQEDGFYDEEMRVPSPEGTVRWVECLGHAYHDDTGKPLRAAGIALDITGRKRTEEALRSSEEKLRLALDAAQMGTWDLDVSRGGLAFSERGRALFGLSSQKATALEAFLAAVLPEDRERIRRALRQTLEEERLFDEEMRVPWPDGTLRWVACQGRAFRDAAGRPVRMAGTALDITARKRAEEALREADQRKGEFLAVLSHELRNPLTPIKNSLYLLGRLPPGASQAAQAMAVIDRQVEHLTRLVDDLLDLTRISRNKIELRLERLELGELLRTTAEDHRSLFEPRGIRLETVLPPGPLFARADRTRVAQVVGNLLQNAAKFTPRGGLARLIAAEEGGRAVIRVVDSGAGMTAPMLTRLFQPFVQADTTLERSKGGLGLGLALVKGLVELQGGEVSASSAGLGKGSELEVSLPLDSAGAHGEHAPRSAAPGRRRILVIEDNVDAAESLRDLLAMEGHQVFVAYDGPSGLLRAHELQPQVVFCDIGLPGVDGYEVARRLRSDAALKGCLLVALSGYALQDDIESAKSAGFDRHMAKPPRLEKLEELLLESPGP
jgi:PAS domain S-box-containing protein